VNGRFRLGALSLASADLLPTGSIHPIDGGSALVHSLLHLAPAHRAVLRRLLAGQEPGAAAADLATADPGIEPAEGPGPVRGGRPRPGRVAPAGPDPGLRRRAGRAPTARRAGVSASSQVIDLVELFLLRPPAPRHPRNAG